MKLVHVVLFLYGSSTIVVAEKRYPSLLMERTADKIHNFISTKLAQFSSHKEDRAPAFFTPPRSDEWNVFVCPARPHYVWEQAMNKKSESKNAVFYREHSRLYIFTDQPMPTCELPLRGAIDLIWWMNEKNILYRMRIEVCTIFYHLKDQVNWADGNENFNSSPTILSFNFDQTINMTTHVEYTISEHTTLTASSKTDDIPYDKNLQFLRTDVDLRYNHFRSRILPRMKREKSANPLAHCLGIQKVRLALRDDFDQDALKTITYADIITTPIWRSLLLKWNAVEIFVRKYANIGSSVFIKNGIAGTLAWVNDYYEEGDDESKKLRVPEYVWKMVCSWEICERAVLIVMHNNPFVETKPHSCSESCAKYGWLVDNNDYRTGLIYCCKITKEVIDQFGVHLGDVQTVNDITQRNWHRAAVYYIVSAPTKSSYNW